MRQIQPINELDIYQINNRLGIIYEILRDIDRPYNYVKSTDFKSSVINNKSLNKIIAVTSTLVVSETIDVPSNLYVLFIYPGKLQIADGCTVNFHSPGNIIAPPRQQIFSGLGTVKFTIGGRLPVPWMEADWTGASDCSDAIAKAINSIDTALPVQGGSYPKYDYRPIVYFPAGTYYLSSGVVFTAKTFLTFEGDGASSWIKVANGVTAFTTGDGTDDTYWTKFRNLNFTGSTLRTDMATPATAATRGIWMRGSRQGSIEHCGFYDLADGIRWTNSSMTNIRKCVFYRNNYHIICDTTEAAISGAGPDQLWISECAFANSTYAAIRWTEVVLEFVLRDSYIDTWGYNDNSECAIELASCADAGGITTASTLIVIDGVRFEYPQSDGYAVKIDDLNSLDGSETWNYAAKQVSIKNCRTLRGLTNSANNGMYIDHVTGAEVNWAHDPGATNPALYIGTAVHASHFKFIWGKTDNPDATAAIITDNATDETNLIEIVDLQSGEIFEWKGGWSAPPRFAKTRRCTGLYDFGVDGGAIAAYMLGYIPNNAMVTKAWYEVLTAPTSGGAATISFGVHGDDNLGILTATAYNNAIFTEGFHDTTCDGTAANFTTKTTTNSKYVKMNIAGAVLTAGKIRLWWEYIVGD